MALSSDDFIGEQLIDDAIFSGNFNKLKKLLHKRIELNGKHKHDIYSEYNVDLNEALHSLSEDEDTFSLQDKIELADLLFQAGADINSKSSNGKTALEIAFHSANDEFANYLKDKGGLVLYEAISQNFKRIKKEALNLISSIKKYRRSRIKDWKCLSQYLELQKNYINYHPYGWQPIYQKIERVVDTPRTGNLVFANFYTSKKFPWPRQLDKPMAPVLQIDLRTIQNKFKQSKQTGDFPYHSGLLQVWERTNNEDNVERSFIRIIPDGEFDLDCITDERPAINPNDYFCTVRAGYGSNHGYGATIVSWKKLPLSFTSGYVSISDIEYKPQSEAEQNAIDVEETVTTLVEENQLAYNESHLFGVDSVSSSGWNNYLNGWQILFEFSNDEIDYSIGAGNNKALVLWKDDKLRLVII